VTGILENGSSSWVLSRIEKLEDFLTALYEIDMLRFAYWRIFRPIPTEFRLARGDSIF
jgi:hypothetical protein